MKVSLNESKSRDSSAVRRRNKRLRLPSIFPNRLYISQSQERKMLYTCNNTSMAKTSMVHNSTNNFSTESNFDTTNQTSFDEFPRKNSFSSSEVPAKWPNHIRESSSITGLSKQAVELITTERRESSISGESSVNGVINKRLIPFDAI